MNKKDKKIKAQKKAAIFSAIGESSIPDQIGACLLKALACDIELRLIMDRIKTIYAAAGMIPDTQSETILSGIASFSDYVKKACAEFERRLEPHINDATYSSCGVAAGDSFRFSANNVCRLVLLLIDRGSIEGGLDEIEKAIMSLPTSGRFTDSDLEMYRTR